MSAFVVESDSEGEGDLLTSMHKADTAVEEEPEMTDRDIANERRRAMFSGNPKKRMRALDTKIEKEKMKVKKNTSVIIQLQTMEGENTGPEIQIDTATTTEQLEEILNQLVECNDPQQYAFYSNAVEIMSDVHDFLKANNMGTEKMMTIKYQPLSLFKVRPVTRCSHDMPGHTDSIIHVSFSPDGEILASGGGDTTVRFWDIYTATPVHVMRGHKHHVLETVWSPDGKFFASADFNGEVRLWDPKKGEQIGAAIKAHAKWITGMVWQPHHLNANCDVFATCSKDKLAKVYNARTRRKLTTLAGHTDSVEDIRWGGTGLIYTGSRDRTIKVWRLDDKNRGIIVRTLVGHAHRVNTLALNCDYVCRTGAFSHTQRDPDEPADVLFKAACARYEETRRSLGKEVLVSGSDDFTMYMWEPEVSKKHMTRLTGHQNLINHINFSPDGRYIASAGFDKKVKVWDGHTGKFVATLNGHVDYVYQVVWSADSRMLISGSKDSTCKVWQMSNLKRAKVTLSGHEDEVFTLDWAPNGERLASGSRDRMIKIWQN